MDPNEVPINDILSFSSLDKGIVRNGFKWVQSHPLFLRKIVLMLRTCIQGSQGKRKFCTHGLFLTTPYINKTELAVHSYATGPSYLN